MIPKPSPYSRDFVAKAGCEVITAVDGFDALAKIAESNPDIIFVDIMMPRLMLSNLCPYQKQSRLRSKARHHAVIKRWFV